jgi:putative transposase
VPQDLARSWHRERDDWLQRRGIDPKKPDWRKAIRTSTRLEQEYEDEFTRRFLEWLDGGLGECALCDPQAASIVANTLSHFDGVRYYLGDFVVMPNHVHLLVCLIGQTEIQSLCESWKRFSGREINKSRGRTGRFWQEESFDHLVRGPDELAAFRRYIAENPRRAGLSKGTYLLRSLDGTEDCAFRSDG